MSTLILPKSELKKMDTTQPLITTTTSTTPKVGDLPTSCDVTRHSEKKGIAQDNKTVFDQIANKISGVKSGDKKIEDVIKDVQSKIPQPKNSVGPKPEIKFSELSQNIPIKSDEKKPDPITIKLPGDEPQITSTEQKCRQCHKTKPISEFGFDTTGRRIKTCNICRAKTIQNPKQIFENVKATVGALASKASEIEKFDRQKCIDALVGVKRDRDILNMMSDDELKKARLEEFTKTVERLNNLDEVLFDLGLMGAMIVEKFPFEQFYGFSLEGLTAEIQNEREEWLQIISQLSDSYPDIIKTISDPKKQAGLRLAMTAVKVGVANYQKKKKAEEMNGGGGGVIKK